MRGSRFRLATARPAVCAATHITTRSLSRHRSVRARVTSGTRLPSWVAIASELGPSRKAIWSGLKRGHRTVLRGGPHSSNLAQILSPSARWNPHGENTRYVEAVPGGLPGSGGGGPGPAGALRRAGEGHRGRQPAVRGAAVADRVRRHRAAADLAVGAGGGRGAAGLHRAAPGVSQPRGPGARGPLPHHLAAGRGDQPLRHEDRRPLAGGRGGRAAGGAAGLRGLPAPPAGPGAAGDRGGQRVLGARVPHPRPGDQGADRLVLAGAGPRRRALPAAAARAAAAGVAAGAGAGGPRRPRPGGASNLGGTRARHEVVELDRDGFTPDRDFEVPLRGGAARLGLRHDNLVVARVRPLDGKLPPDPVRGLLVLVDTSASRALGFARSGGPAVGAADQPARRRAATCR